MRFLLVGRDQSGSAARLLSEVTYESRREALDELGRLAASGDLGDLELFCVDLDAVSPVVLYQTPAVAAPVTPALEPERVDEAAADASEQVAEPVEVAAGDAAEVGAAVDDQDEVESPEEPKEDLSAALRRAATALEDAGIVTPPSVEEFAASASSGVISAGEDDQPPVAQDPETAPATAEEAKLWPWESARATEPAPPGAMPEEPVEDQPSEPPAADEVLVDELPADEVPAAEMLADAVPADEVPADEMPPVEPPAPDADIAPESEAKADGPAASDADDTEQPAAPTFQPVGLEEPGLEEITLLTPGMAEDFSAAAPLIIGEYAEDSSFSASAFDDEPAPVSAADPEATAPEATAPEATVDAAPPAAASAPPESRSERADGDTCDDCVYVETCPKAHQEGPATCGSFQWKAE